MAKIENASREKVEAYAIKLGAHFMAVETGEALIGKIIYKGTESPLVAYFTNQPDYLAFTNIEKMVELLKRVTD